VGDEDGPPIVARDGGNLKLPKKNRQAESINFY
jgi:hypothetical protein